MENRIDIFTKNIDLTNEIQEYVVKKAAKLERYLKQIDETRIDIAFSKTARDANDRFTAQITLRGKGFILRAEERASEIRPAIDLVMDKIQRQIERYKGKRFQAKSEAKPTGEVLAEQIAMESDKQDAPVIARRKKFTLVPMNELEAIEQMNLLGHEDFFIFYNATTSKINALYRRRDGTYGLIEPELG